ncbi:helix-turn-helix transcriptional regulator, partial [Acinetobacter baumannii]
FLPDPNQTLTLDPIIFSTAYGLTAAEARVLSELTLGLDIHEVAQKFNTSVNTARTHLRNIMAKTGTHRQTDLILKFTNLPHLFIS